MREKVRDKDRINHIVEAINAIVEYKDKYTLQEAQANPIIYYGFVKYVEIIGEAAYHLSQAFRNTHPETKWEDIMRMRNVLVHDYYQIKDKEVWGVIKNDLQPLHDQIARYIAETDWSEWEKNGQVIAESASHKTLVQTARRMKGDGMNAKQISRYTGLSTEEIEQI